MSAAAPVVADGLEDAAVAVTQAGQDLALQIEVRDISMPDGCTPVLMSHRSSLTGCFAARPAGSHTKSDC